VIPLQHEILRRAVSLPLENRDVKITTAEDLILLKMAFHREKDLGDVRGILRVQRGRLDEEYVRNWARQMLEDGVQQELEQLFTEYGTVDESGS
jgi:predicted nucleotidyltransferase